ncbi:MAG: hypothetical protein RSD77_07315 [Romboutsia sp.]
MISIVICEEEILKRDLTNIDILLLDIQMGQINGMDTARKIREVDNIYNFFSRLCKRRI